MTEAFMTPHSDEKAWYPLIVYPNREIKIQERLIQKVKNNPSLKGLIFRLFVPTIKETNEKGKTRVVPLVTQYVYVEMIHTNETYHAVKIDGVRHILPPIQEEEMEEMHRQCGLIYVPNVSLFDDI